MSNNKNTPGKNRERNLHLLDSSISQEEFESEFTADPEDINRSISRRNRDSVGSLASAANDLSETLRSSLDQERKLRAEISNVRNKNEELDRALKAAQSKIRSLQTQLDQANNRHEQVLQRYDELLSTSQAELSSADTARRAAETEVKQSREKIEEITRQLNANLLKNENAVISREQYDSILLDVQKQEFELNQQISALRSELDSVHDRLDDTIKSESKSQLERANALAKMRQVAEGAIYQSVQLSDARDQLNSSIRIMEGLLRSMKQKNVGALEGLEDNGGALSKKVRSMLIEQWKMEIDNLRKLDILLAEIIASAKNLKGN